MIPSTARLEIVWLDTASLVPRFDEPEMDLDQVARYVDMLRRFAGAGHTTPVEVEPEVAGRSVIRNGRHRWAAHVALCIPRIRCMIVHPPPPAAGRAAPC